MRQKIKSISAAVLLGLFLFANFASAALVTCGGPTTPECKITDIILLIVRIINFLLEWAWLISLFMILWSAFTLLGSSGNEEAVTAGKDTLKQAIIGFFLIMIAYLLINWLVSALTGNCEAVRGPDDPPCEAVGGAFQNVFKWLR
jgi:hypothetical protein